MTRLKAALRSGLFLASALLWLLPAPARAQGAATILGPTVNGHLMMLLGRGGQAMDAGGPTTANGPPQNSLLPGTRPTGLGLVNSGLGYCQWTGYANAAYSEFCSGFDGSGNALISVQRIGGGPVPQLNYLINGVLYPFPGVLQGILGPSTTKIGNIASWGNTAGTLLSDVGVGIYSTKAYSTFVNNFQNILCVGQNSCSAAIHIGATGEDEVAFGHYTLSIDVSGKDNTAIGDHALSLLTSGNSNTCVGSAACSSIGVGTFNTGIGVSALQNTSSANDATGVGISAMQNLIDGPGNTCIGVQCLFSLASSSNNAALGMLAGYNLAAGSGNLFLGYSAAYDVTTGTNNIVIGNNAGSGSIGSTVSSRLWIGIGGSPLLYGDLAGLQLAIGTKVLGASTLAVGAPSAGSSITSLGRASDGLSQIVFTDITGGTIYSAIQGTSTAGGTLTFATNGSLPPAMTITGSQQVGIGTASPMATVDVVGGIVSRAASGGTSMFSWGRTSDDLSQINFYDHTGGTLYSQIQGTSTGNGSLKFITNNVLAMTIDALQHVSIGGVGASVLNVTGTVTLVALSGGAAARFLCLDASDVVVSKATACQ